ncbi:MAG TPA: Rdx family protein [Gammaproteobacteria bacterium]|nr:Rdx family protein [Gammaproteobacteria bacterium]
MNGITITYCKPCGYEKRAVTAAEALKAKLRRSAKLIPGRGGIFEVQVGGKTVVRRTRTHFPDAEEIVTAVAEVLKVG